MVNRIQIRRGTAAAWTAANPVLAIGERGFESDTGLSKTGDGVTAWVGLAYEGVSDSRLATAIGVGATGAALSATYGREGTGHAAPGVGPLLDFRPNPTGGGAFTFQAFTAGASVPGSWTGQLTDGANYGNAAASSDFTLKVENVPAGTETTFEAIQYADYTASPDGYSASASLAATGVTVAVKTVLSRLARNVWRKTITLTPTVDTSVILRQNHVIPLVQFNGRGGTQSRLQAVPTTFETKGAAMGTRQGVPCAGLVMPTNAAASQALVMIAADGIEGDWSRSDTAGIVVDAGLYSTTHSFIGVTYGRGNASAAKMAALKAGVPRRFSFTYALAPFSADVTNATSPAFRAAVIRAHALSSRVQSDPFTSALVSSAKGSYGYASDTSRTLMVQPAPFYDGQWMRDSFWTCVGLGDAAISGTALTWFSLNMMTGAVATAYNLTAGTPTKWSMPDEANQLYMLWAYWHLCQTGQTIPLTTERDIVLAWLEGNVDVNGYWKEGQPGSANVGWYDSMVQPHLNYATAYTTGLTYVALRAAYALGAPVNLTKLATVKAAYLSFYQGGYLRTVKDRDAGTYKDWVDVTALMPEFWNQYLFGDSILTTAQMAGTMDKLVATNLTKINSGRGFKIIVAGNGGYLPNTAFSYPTEPVKTEPGVYHNGASWLLFDFCALAAARFHGYITNDLDKIWADRIVAELGKEMTSHEHLDTTSTDGMLGTCRPANQQYAWNALILAAEPWSKLRRPKGQ